MLVRKQHIELKKKKKTYKLRQIKIFEIIVVGKQKQKIKNQEIQSPY